MYAGHFAVAVALRARFPRTPVIPIVFGIGLLDMICGVLVASGVERVSPAPEDPLGLSLDFVDWDHSLLMAAVWAIAFGALFVRRDRLTGAVAAAAVFSHFVTDALVHNGDLALWPGANVHLGTFLWRDHPVGSWFFELGFSGALAGWAILHARKAGVPPRAWRGTVIVLLVLQLSFLPPIAPLHLAGSLLTGPPLGWAFGILVIAGFLIPGTILVRLLPGDRRPPFGRAARAG